MFALFSFPFFQAPTYLLSSDTTMGRLNYTVAQSRVGIDRNTRLMAPASDRPELRRSKVESFWNILCRCTPGTILGAMLRSLGSTDRYTLAGEAGPNSAARRQETAHPSSTLLSARATSHSIDPVLQVKASLYDIKGQAVV